MYENARKYNLTGTDAMVFEALVYLCRKDGNVSISYSKLATFSCCGGRLTAMRSVKRLLNMGIIVQNEQGSVQIEHKSVQNEPIPKEERTKEEKINNNKSLPAIIARDKPTDGGLAGFDLFWENFSPSGEFVRRKNACQKMFAKLPPDWQLLAIEKAKEHPPDRNPFFFLRDEDFLHEAAHPPAEKTSPEWLNGYQQDEALAKGIPLAVCRNPETGMFATCTKDDAEKFKLNILRIM